MTLNTYTLYLDEIQANPPFQYFCLAGVVIKDSEYNEIKAQINKIKIDIFGDENVILHEADIRTPKNITKADAMSILVKDTMSKGKIKKKYFDRVVEFFKANEFTVLSASLHQNNVAQTYPGHRDKYFMALQIIMENFTHFLIENKAKGKIVIESRMSESDTNLDDQLYTHFTQLRCITGTLFYESSVISKYIRSITFIEKSQNEIGLQIADMIPNALNRHLSSYRQATEGLYEEIESKTYCGNRSNIKRFGQKVLVKSVDPLKMSEDVIVDEVKSGEIKTQEQVAATNDKG